MSPSISFFNTQIKSNSWEIKLQISSCSCCTTVLSGVFLLVRVLNQIDRDVQEACRRGFQNYLIMIAWLVSSSDAQERKTQGAIFVDLCCIRNMERKKYLPDGEG